MKILGIDPGSQITGYGLVERQRNHYRHIDNGGVFTSSKDSFPDKLHTLYHGITDLILQFSPDAMAVETIFYAKNVRSALQLAHARGVILACGAAQKLPIFEYSPLSVKQAIVGYGRASKEQVQTMVKHLLKLPEKTFYDSSDALAVAICHLNHLKSI